LGGKDSIMGPPMGRRWASGAEKNPVRKTVLGKKGVGDSEGKRKSHFPGGGEVVALGGSS